MITILKSSFNDNEGAGIDTDNKQPIILIIGKWKNEIEIIENAIIGIISHEIIEYIINNITEVKDTDYDLHGLIGYDQEIKDYINNFDGIVINEH